MKKTLLLSMLALLLCVTMLIGTTYAWFVDNVSSTNNIIRTGNLSIDFEYSADKTAWNTVTGNSNIFGSEVWEPDHTLVRYFRITNREGNLNAKYSVKLSFPSTLSDIQKKLLENIDIYLKDVTDGGEIALSANTPATAAAEASDPLESMEYGGTLGQLGTRSLAIGYTQSGKSHTFALVMKMRSDAPVSLASQQIDNILFQAVATQVDNSEGEFNYQLSNDKTLEFPVARKTVTRQVQILENVKSPLSAEAAFLDKGVYVFADHTLFANKLISRIGIPINAIDTSGSENSFIVSVIKTEEATSTTALPRKQITLKVTNEMLSNSANGFVYFDVDLDVGADETLSFNFNLSSLKVSAGVPGDHSMRYFLNGALSDNASIPMIDVYETETLEFVHTEYGFAALKNERVLPEAVSLLPEASIASAPELNKEGLPAVYLKSDLFEESTVTRLGIPVKSVANANSDNKLTVYVVNVGDASKTPISTHVITLTKEMTGTDTAVNKWIYVDGLDITVGKGQTLAFGASDDTVTLATLSGCPSDTFKTGDSSYAIFDVCKETALTYEDYLKQAAAESSN